MPIEIKKEIELEIAHVLFIDIVGYSKLPISDQHAAIEELNQVVRASERFQRAEAAGRLIKIPTGDGIALVFIPAQGGWKTGVALRACALLCATRILQFFCGASLPSARTAEAHRGSGKRVRRACE